MLSYGIKKKESCASCLENGIQWLVWFAGTKNLYQEDLKEVFIFGQVRAELYQKAMKVESIA